ncbi:hypothetical protein [Streptomyces sp. TR1341]|uniref:hypothetical protein n=1 Tax=Streptomyces sp. TR1341 TaxID=2601266 RepID=UPI00192EA30F
MALPLLVAYTATSLTGGQLDTPEPLERGSLPYHLVAATPAAALFIAVLLRLAFALAPAAAATGLGPRAALRRSWSLTRTRAGATRVLALTLPPAALCAAVTRLATQLALPLRPLVRTLLEQATGNFFAAYYAGVLAPAIVGILVTAATTLPLTCTAFAALHDHRRPSRTSPGGIGERGGLHRLTSPARPGPEAGLAQPARQASQLTGPLTVTYPVAPAVRPRRCRAWRGGPRGPGPRRG